ncbi:MAG: hypothetical protein OJF60_001512 [Burkholderiaceae bacterium]|jgi:uncharacterized protein (DUF58 family)|nr:MAG: hypothetical protein OJF60_001512 [Burkholderiaceae bacterium]
MTALTRRNPVSHLAARARQWWHNRIAPSDTIVLRQRNVYILPTRAGLMLGATLVVLLVASINYQLNLGYLLTFLLTGCGLVSMYVCHATLRGLTLNLAAPSPCFLGASATLEVQLASRRRTVRYGVGLTTAGERRWAWTDVPAQGSTTLRIAFQPAGRGLQQAPTLIAETRYPLGTFRVWSIWRPAARVLVYPAPEPRAPALPPGEPRGGGRVDPLMASTEFDGARAYRRGDPARLVLWKKAAKTLAGGSGELVSRDTERAQANELWLDFAQAGALPAEQRLSRLCAWVLRADGLNLRYGLRLPGLTVTPASGDAQRRRCLEALALC